jgi:PIN domain nuclease of toxin-antitoxin system
LKLLLDTHILLWACQDLDRLNPAARAAIADGGNLVLVTHDIKIRVYDVPVFNAAP